MYLRVAKYGLSLELFVCWTVKFVPWKVLLQTQLTERWMSVLLPIHVQTSKFQMFSLDSVKSVEMRQILRDPFPAMPGCKGAATPGQIQVLAMAMGF